MQMFGRIQVLCTILSKSLAEMGVTEMPLISFGDDALLVFGMAVSFACL